jgi:hypothetical protein
LDRECRLALNRSLPPPPVLRLIKRFWNPLGNNADLVYLNLSPSSVPAQHNASTLVLPPYARKGRCSDFEVPPANDFQLQQLTITVIVCLSVIFIIMFIMKKVHRHGWKRPKSEASKLEPQETRSSKDVQMAPGPYSVWVPNFVARSPSLSLYTFAVGAKSKLLEQSSSFENDGYPQDSTLGPRKQKYVVCIACISRNSEMLLTMALGLLKENKSSSDTGTNRARG